MIMEHTDKIKKDSRLAIGGVMIILEDVREDEILKVRIIKNPGLMKRIGKIFKGDKK